MIRICDRLLLERNCHVSLKWSACYCTQNRRTQIVKYKDRFGRINDRNNDGHRFRQDHGRQNAFKSFKYDDSSHYDKRKFFKEEARRRQDDASDYDDGYDDEHDYDDEILNADRKYNEYKQEEHGRYNKMVYNIIKKKYFKPPSEPCLLTWAAKEQLRYLHETDPENWTPEKLAESFPISVPGVVKLLKSNFRHRTGEKISAHDKAVYSRYKQLQLGEGPILAALHPRLSTRELGLENMNENQSLPMPKEEWKTRHLPNTRAMARGGAPVGEFESLIVEYKSLCQKTGGVASEHMPSSENDGGKLPLDLAEPLPLPFATKQKGRRKSITIEEFKGSMKRDLLRKSIDDPEPYQKFKSWLQENDTAKQATTEPVKVQEFGDDMADLFEGKIPQYRYDSPEVKWDVHRDTENPKGEEAYIYDEQRGYQRPYGRYEDNDRIEIPPDRRQEGAVYRKGNCYYDDTGEFLYRVPFPLE